MRIYVYSIFNFLWRPRSGFVRMYLRGTVWCDATSIFFLFSTCIILKRVSYLLNRYLDYRLKYQLHTVRLRRQHVRQPVERARKD